jgi:Asp-tRNA(Asn)/Glu-tRNA(Gln) amidotransferase A subunit family amidase
VTDFQAAGLLAKALRDRELSAVELLDETLANAERIAPLLNPFAAILHDRARPAAEQADRLLAAGEGGPLCGVPVTVKDSVWVGGEPCEHGCRALEGTIAPASSEAVCRLEAAGAVVFAKTTCSELSFAAVTDTELCGRTSNPHDAARTPGGSSGGAGAAVAAGAGLLALGADDGGSIRIPAAFCGVVGHKPTFGLVPTAPETPVCPTLNAVGPLARSVSDARLALSILADDPLPAAPVALEQTRLAALNARELPLTPAVRRRYEQLAASLADAGATIVEVERSFEASRRVYETTASWESYAALRPLLERRDLLGDEVARLIESGARVDPEAYAAAQEQRGALRLDHVDILDRTGAVVLLTPAVGCEAVPHEHEAEIRGRFDWFLDANLGGFPACVLPVGRGDEGLPIGLQIVGRAGEDGTVLNVAESIERLVVAESSFGS